MDDSGRRDRADPVQRVLLWRGDLAPPATWHGATAAACASASAGGVDRAQQLPRARLDRGARRHVERAMKGQVIKFEPEDYVALDQLARDRMMTFQELADEAFRDLLKKHGRPTDLKEALRKSARAADADKKPARAHARKKRR